jgi:hypothetical protein
MEDNLNHHTNPSGLIEAARKAAGPQYLGDVAFVDRLVRHFVAEILERFYQVGRGSLMSIDAADADRQACEKMAQIFSGIDPSFTSVFGWNGAGLANHLRETMSNELPESDCDTEVIADAFAVLVHSVYDSLRRLDEGDNPDFLQGLERSTKSFAYRLLGVA